MKLSRLTAAVAMCLAAHLGAAEMRDPTRPGSYQADIQQSERAASSDDLRLQAIFYSPGRAAVLINGRLYAVGDLIGNVKLTAVYADRVILRDATGQRELRLVSQVYSRPTESSRQQASEDFQ